MFTITGHSPEKLYEYRNSWNLIKITIIVIISKSCQGKAYLNEAGKKPS